VNPNSTDRNVTARELLAYDDLLRNNLKSLLTDLAVQQGAVNNSLGMVLMALIDAVAPTLDGEAQDKLYDALVLADLELSYTMDK
jgi:hypothetical protein